MEDLIERQRIIHLSLAKLGLRPDQVWRSSFEPNEDNLYKNVLTFGFLKSTKTDYLKAVSDPTHARLYPQMRKLSQSIATRLLLRSASASAMSQHLKQMKSLVDQVMWDLHDFNLLDVNENHERTGSVTKTKKVRVRKGLREVNLNSNSQIKKKEEAKSSPKRNFEVDKCETDPITPNFKRLRISN